MAEILKTLSAEQFLLLSKTYSKCLSLTLAQWGNLILLFTTQWCFAYPVLFFVYQTVSEDFIYMNLFYYVIL